MYRLGIIQKQSETYLDAYETFLQAIEFGNQDSWLLFYQTGQCAFKIQRYQDAIDCLMHACTINKHNIHVWCLLAVSYSKLVKFGLKVAINVSISLELIVHW